MCGQTKKEKKTVKKKKNEHWVHYSEARQQRGNK